ncbi:MAG: ArsR family transcriptional regulator [Candidatus Bathyarchaeota archaeon B24]|nr:MAG: ArsR family transcriptional regulator [Candidatus Bathyarchaeota archaeon B24]
MGRRRLVFDYRSWKARVVAMELTSKLGRAIIGRMREKTYITASQLARDLNAPLPTVLYHLTRLRIAGLVEMYRGYGKRFRPVIYYKLSPSEVVIDLGGEKIERGGEGENRDRGGCDRERRGSKL